MSASEEKNPNIFRIAKEDFELALRKGFWRSVMSWLKQSSNTLLPYDEVRQALPFRGQHYIGLKQIELDRVVGSVGRYQDFDRIFLPRRVQTRGRWISIDMAHLQDVDLPPIEVYKLGEVYFVKDGNHRVSVARERGQVYIDAYVIEVNTPLAINTETDVDNIIRRREEIAFLDQTHLLEMRPDAKIELTLPGGYEKLLEHINVHRWFMGERSQTEILWNDGSAGWYDEVYLPLVEVVRENRILKKFPGRTEADLYVWIIDHLWYLRQDYDQEVSLQEAAVHFSEEYSEQPLKQLIQLIRSAAHLIGDGDGESG